MNKKFTKFPHSTLNFMKKKKSLRQSWQLYNKFMELTNLEMITKYKSGSKIRIFEVFKLCIWCLLTITFTSKNWAVFIIRDYLKKNNVSQCWTDNPPWLQLRLHFINTFNKGTTSKKIYNKENIFKLSQYLKIIFFQFKESEEIRTFRANGNPLYTYEFTQTILKGAVKKRPMFK